MTQPLEEAYVPQIQEQLAQQQADDADHRTRASARGAHQEPGDLARSCRRAGADGAGVGLLPARRSGARPRRGTAGGGARPSRWPTARSAAGRRAQRGVVFVTVAGKKDPACAEARRGEGHASRQDAIRAKAAELSKQRANELAADLKSAANFAARGQGAGARGQGRPTSSRAARSIPDVGTNPDVDKAGVQPAGRRRERSDRHDGRHGDRRRSLQREASDSRTR